MNIYYHLSHYISHRNAGMDYIVGLKNLGLNLVHDINDADVIILHDDPLNYSNVLRLVSKSRYRKIIAYSVWETEDLPLQYLEPLRLVDEIWTCTPFSATAFLKHFEKVRVLEHVVSRVEPSIDDLMRITSRIGHHEDGFYFYSIVDSVNPRKNLRSLLDVFAKNFHSHKNVHLVVKQYRHAVDLASLPQVISIDKDLSPGELSALHRFCDCYISLHHAEAWGLTISDAMFFGNPVIATGYSGNMHYMSEANSYPVNHFLDHVHEEMCRRIPLYRPEMKWAYPDLRHAGYLMKKLSRDKKNPKLRNAIKDMSAFGLTEITHKMRSLLELP
ncbi:Glycosyl transferases group 1 [Desulfonatronum thiosulfatophilum]|uniref:Glycosyl transferases group 1 n=1 Tax=Desulfonatronum thiosulfatophilum TaxID=617002 RepID=A0A1G6BYN2_9BACT|nr:glycosyltransferase [Desulfonatronum thiosulfatophilum]SDB25697.1 Glycosyl transferases group 1 [Desulfonatronum thiosulfatophilum]